MPSPSFGGLRNDSFLDKKYAQQRWYSQYSGLWLSLDSIGSSGRLRTPNALGPYLYVRGNPLRYTNPSGNDPPDIQQKEDKAGYIVTQQLVSGDVHSQEEANTVYACVYAGGGEGCGPTTEQVQKRGGLESVKSNRRKERSGPAE